MHCTTEHGSESTARIALYSHDTMGLGHLRRNQLIAQSLAASSLNPGILTIAGVHEAGLFAMPPGVDRLTLPAYRKDHGGGYAPRSLRLGTEALTALRARVMGAALESFEPDLLIVDNVPRGALEELNPVLERLKARGRTRCVLGLRDVLDTPARVRTEWRRRMNISAIREYYDAVWIYGDQAVYDATREYALPPDIAKKTRFTGYLDPAVRLGRADCESHPSLPERFAEQPFTLCVVGGGQDGRAIGEAFLQAQLPRGELGVLVTGPFLPPEEQRRIADLAADNPRVSILGLVNEPMRLMQRASRVIAMGGYNSVMEILSLGKPALLVPRDRPRLEQRIRAERLRNLGLIDVLGSEDLDPRSLSRWMHADAATPGASIHPRARIDLLGLDRVRTLAGEMLGRVPRCSIDPPRPELCDSSLRQTPRTDYAIAS
ncbi:glycosyltransferase [Thiocapsa sp.]|uniref:glycosyltransferase family protein n=1 Tax=Thiocapsa sp. TaxID=2024551 RepID=UPI0025EE1CD0|nr:glycosyltransferase [Thiocapsa sp.]